jgi:hypothetical protein
MKKKRQLVIMVLLVLGAGLVYGTGKSTNILRSLMKDSAGPATITWEATASATQVVERTSSLNPDNADWQGIYTSVPPNQGTNTFTDPLPPDAGAYYRIQQVQ